MDIKKYWMSVLAQDEVEVGKFFREDAVIRWHNTNEEFTLDEFIKVNCTYLGTWDGEIETVLYKQDLIVSAVRVFNKEKTQSHHVVSFIRLKCDKIVSIDEYWGSDDEPPSWRLDMKVGKPIK